MFNQLTLTCAFVDEAIPCKHASQFQYLNEVIHKPREPFLTDADVTSGISYYSNRIMSDGARARAFEDSRLMAQLGGQAMLTTITNSMRPQQQQQQQRQRQLGPISESMQLYCAQCELDCQQPALSQEQQQQQQQKAHNDRSASTCDCGEKKSALIVRKLSCRCESVLNLSGLLTCVNVAQANVAATSERNKRLPTIRAQASAQSRTYNATTTNGRHF